MITYIYSLLTEVGNSISLVLSVVKLFTVSARREF